MHEVDTYNSEQTPEIRDLFIRMGTIVRELVPTATQGISYAMPCFLSLYMYSGKTIATLENELKNF